MQQLSMPYFKVKYVHNDLNHSRFAVWVRMANLLGMRIVDLTLIVLAMPILLLLFLLIAIAIRSDSSGPVFFVQERVGARLKVKDDQLIWTVTPFRMMKFRSMVNDADQSLHEEHIKQFVHGTVEATEDSSASVKIAHDPRITRVGNILRKTSLDELPQLINVLKGDMSLVGPRPVPLYEVAEYQEWHFERLAARPGITGLWQIEGRGQVSFEEMIRMDIAYVERQSLWLNLKILARTPFAVLSGRGAA